MFARYVPFSSFFRFSSPAPQRRKSPFDRLPDLDNALINALLLAQDEQQPSRALVQSAINESVVRVSGEPLTKAVSLRSLRNWAIAAATRF